MSARHAVLVATLLAAAACSSPTSPGDGANGRFSPTVLAVSCFGDGSAELACNARTTCAGLACTPEESRDRDVTAEAAWAAVGSSVRHAGGGRFASVNNGAAAVVATLARLGLQSSPLAVEAFLGRQPQQVYRMFGRVGHGEMSTGPFPVPTIDQALDGVTVDIITGFAAGRQAVTGRPADPRLGLPSSLSQPGEFEIMGVPDGELTLWVRPPGQPPLFVHLRSPHFLPAILVPR